MTICGISVVSPISAVTWADSEIFTDEAPSGHACKLAVNALAGILAVATGRLALLRETAAALSDCVSFDEASVRLPERLRQAALSYCGMDIAARDPLGVNLHAIVGYSHRYGRVVGAIFRGDRDFEPVLPCRRFLAPQFEDPEKVDHELAIITVAQRQLELLRRQSPEASGGALVIAELRAGSIRVRPAFDLASGRMLSRTPALNRLGAPCASAARDHSQVFLTTACAGGSS